MAGAQPRKDTSIGDLQKKSRKELLELLGRQNKLLSNVNLIRKLHDKGQKIHQTKLKIEEALRQADKSQQLNKLFQNLKLHDRSTTSTNQNVEPLDSDDEDTTETSKLFVTLATNDIPGKMIVPAEQQCKEPFSSPADSTKYKPVASSAFQIDDNSPAKPSNDPFAQKIIDIEEHQLTVTLPHHFLPNRDTHSDISTYLKKPEGYKSAAATRPWVDTAVTPPASQFAKAKTLTLQESCDLQSSQAHALKELEMQRSIELLMRRIPTTNAGSAPTGENFTTYREERRMEDESAEEEEEEEENED